MLGIALVLVVWLLTLGGEDTSSDAKSGGPRSGDSGGAAITPGPTPSGPHYTQRPGGRDESGTGGGTGGSAGDSGGSGQGSVGGLGSVGGGTGGTGGGSGGSGGGSGAGPAAGALGAGAGTVLAHDTKVPDCTSGAVHVAVRSVKSAYKPGERPKFEIVVRNSGGSACKVNLGSPGAVLKITDPSGGQHVWASDDCPRGRGDVLVEVPASGETKRTLEWDRARSAPQCATASAGTPAQAGAYRAEVKIAGVAGRAEFVLDEG
ncbi:hypothetical protein [Streptomyces luteireticuli]|uniref:DUF4232 domain-containing protein n=1 Tax=Streptomyces luteireticuli TaxID=173858 RepID=A0ABP3I155_9ACTN